MQRNRIIKTAQYLNIVNILITKFNFDSLFKLVFTSFVSFNHEGKIPFSNTKNNMLEGFFQQFHYELLVNYKDFGYIFEAIKILQDNQFIEIDGNSIVVKKEPQYINDDFFSKTNIISVLDNIKQMNEESFVEEVLYNV